jgi:hypothetical protein
MIVQFDSKNPTGRPLIRGQHNGNPRLWVVKVRADDLEDSLTFTPKGKVYIRDLSELIDSKLKEEGVTTGRVRWTATAR